MRQGDVCILQENEAVQEEKKKQLYEEGIDAILARAEVSCCLILYNLNSA